jgi:hypothetical protein
MFRKRSGISVGAGLRPARSKHYLKVYSCYSAFHAGFVRLRPSRSCGYGLLRSIKLLKLEHCCAGCNLGVTLGIDL